MEDKHFLLCKINDKHWYHRLVKAQDLNKAKIKYAEWYRSEVKKECVVEDVVTFTIE